ncbi:metalloregulator ArsR/SmtB family transcription factor [Aquimarina sp. ERC-38]|uniref:ArsR/SmtB family transcription factor n=1 Tax=Aquimarina sp. ERC-38 TaxID=2949996 RepID=UPI0022472B41|nr:metalloregulator ArsR/SmtB family transcription factor [Aquimarina sp. ERC-38]UZO79469.1 metalloregulator ArsR/SmtB family transcription factor [Aquimarina sp. ERC-38]
MGVTKTKNFTNRQNELANYAKVLAHPARIAILEFIFESDQCICRDLVKEIGLAQATISQHLKELKAMELLKGSVEGTSVCYCLHTENWLALKKAMSTFLNQPNVSDKTRC